MKYFNIKRNNVRAPI